MCAYVNSYSLLGNWLGSAVDGKRYALRASHVINHGIFIPVCKVLACMSSQPRFEFPTPCYFPPAVVRLFIGQMGLFRRWSTVVPRDGVVSGGLCGGGRGRIWVDVRKCRSCVWGVMVGTEMGFAE